MKNRRSPAHRDRSPPRRLRSILDLSLEECEEILDRAERLRSGGRPRSFRGRVAAMLFFEASTRTRLGFEAAAARLGCATSILLEVRTSSGMSSPESISDTVRSIQGWFDLIVIRHPDPDAIGHVADLSGAPVINAGNGRDEHPTQALVDAFALRGGRKGPSCRIVGLVGDLGWSRAAHSLALHLDRAGVGPLLTCHPEGCGLPDSVLRKMRSSPSRVANLKSLKDADVVYMAGLPEHSARSHHGKAVRRRYRVDMRALEGMKASVRILCPLPRIDEIESRVDGTPNARYFDASTDAVFVRMAILEHFLGAR